MPSTKIRLRKSRCPMCFSLTSLIWRILDVPRQAEAHRTRSFLTIKFEGVFFNRFQLRTPASHAFSSHATRSVALLPDRLHFPPATVRRLTGEPFQAFLYSRHAPSKSTVSEPAALTRAVNPKEHVRSKGALQFACRIRYSMLFRAEHRSYLEAHLRPLGEGWRSETAPRRLSC